MNKLIAALALLALTGCQTCDRHPVVCLTVATSLALSIPAMTNTGAHRVRVFQSGHDVTTQPVNCNGGSCK